MNCRVRAILAIALTLLSFACGGDGGGSRDPFLGSTPTGEPSDTDAPSSDPGSAEALTAAAAPDFDPGFRGYGKVTIQGRQYPYREGASGYVPGSDFVVVGKLDGSSVPGAPYSDFKDASGTSDDPGIYKAWSFLRNQFVNRLDYGYLNPLEWSDEVETTAYLKAIRALGAPAGLDSKKQVLRAQLRAEVPLLINYIQEAVKSDPQRTTLVFEVGNEPNAYPAMHPGLYAWYYIQWQREIKKATTAYNEAALAEAREKGQSAPVPVTAQVMPAGLWMFEGMPQVLKTFLDKGIDINASVAMFDFSLRTRMYVDTMAYYQDFLRYLGEPAFCENLEQYVDQVNGFYLDPPLQLKSNCSDIATYNVKNVQFAYKTERGIDVDPARLHEYKGQEVVKYVKSYERDQPSSALIDIGNLHFYPYIVGGASKTLDEQLTFLNDLSRYVANNTSTGEVWITELGNVNPYSSEQGATKVMAPVLGHLKAGRIPQIKRWYWFESEGNDQKFADLPSIDEFRRLQRLDYSFVDRNGNITPQSVIPYLRRDSTRKVIKSIPALRAIPMDEVLMLAEVVVDMGLVDFNIAVHLTPAQIQEVLNLALPYIQQHPDTGLVTEMDHQLTALGKTFFNMSLMNPGPMGTLSGVSAQFSNYQDVGLPYPPWRTRADVRFHSSGPTGPQFPFIDVWYGFSSTPTNSGSSTRFWNHCFANAGGGYDCGAEIPGFQFGTSYVQFRLTDDVSSVYSNVLKIDNPYPAPTNTPCPREGTSSAQNMELKLPTDPGISFDSLISHTTVNRAPFLLNNVIVSPGSIGSPARYQTRAAGYGITLNGGDAMVINSQDLQSNPPTLFMYPDGICANAECGSPTSFETTNLPTNLTPNDFVVFYPRQKHVFDFVVKNGSSSRTVNVGIASAGCFRDVFPNGNVVALKEVLTQSGDQLQKVIWRPNHNGPFACQTHDLNATFLRSISWTRSNPYWPEFMGYDGSTMTYNLNGTDIPLFRAGHGTPIKIQADIKPSLERFTASIDSASSAKGIRFSTIDNTLTWTPTSSQLGLHIVTLMLAGATSPGMGTFCGNENKNGVPKQVAIEIVAPTSSSTDKTVYRIGDRVTVTGKNFLANSGSAPTATVGGVKASISSIENTRIVVIVPNGAPIGSTSVVVKVGNGTTTRSISVGPTVRSVSGDYYALQGTLIRGKTYTLFGQGFGTSTSSLGIKVGGVTATVLSASSSRATFRAPAVSGSTSIVVTRNSVTSNSFPVNVVATAPACGGAWGTPCCPPTSAKPDGDCGSDFYCRLDPEHPYDPGTCAR